MSSTGVGVIIKNQDGEFLLHLRDGNTTHLPHEWCLIGGRADEGEDAISCAIRETKEETGLALQSPKIVDAFLLRSKDITIVKGTVDSKNVQMHLGEGAALEFFTVQKLSELLTTLPYTNDYLDSLRKNLSL